MFNEPCDDDVELNTYCSCFDMNDNAFYACSNDKCNWNYEMMFWHMSMSDVNGDGAIDREECDMMYDMESIGMCHEVVDHCDANGDGALNMCEFGACLHEAEEMGYCTVMCAEPYEDMAYFQYAMSLEC